MEIKYSFRLAIVCIGLMVLASLIFLRILQIINSEQYAEIDHLRTSIIKAERGGIYTYHNKLLAITNSNYELRFDGTYSDATKQELTELASDLSNIFQNKSKNDYLHHLVGAKNKKYAFLKRNISIEELKKVKKINFYQKPLHGGLIIKQYLVRQKPNLNSAARTIGDLYKENSDPIYGLEYSYNSDLMGKDGQSWILHEPGLDRKIHHSDNIEPVDGQDLITTLSLDYQDILDQALLRQLEHYEASFGTAILMEVKTGQIKAMTNLKKTKSNKYAETLNLAVSNQIEPGSTFKTASMMAYFEDVDRDINDTIDCKHGTYLFKGSPIITVDSKKMGAVSIREAFAHSSNIGIGRMINQYYKANPDHFVNRLYNFGFNKKSSIDLAGVPSPIITSPNADKWSGISLPWMSFGYGINLTALDLITFYNAIANDGYFISPYLGYAIRSGSQITKLSRDQHPYRICSENTINKIQDLLREVVAMGTASKLNNLPFPVSGKTGTTVKNYSDKNQKKEYQASFVGFFPSTNPKYSCIVLIDSPNPELGFYGSEVAVPVFQEIAHKIYTKEIGNWDDFNYMIKIKKDGSLFNHLTAHQLKISDTLGVNKDYYPSVLGLHIRDAIYFLEKSGHKVIIKGGLGYVKKQYPKPNTKIKEHLAITLFT